VAVVDDRGDRGAADADAGEGTGSRQAFAFWAERARSRLAALRSFDAAEAAYEASAEPRGEQSTSSTDPGAPDHHE
jgi:hypothetical protein